MAKAAKVIPPPMPPTLPAETYWRLRYLQACAERDAVQAEVIALRQAQRASRAATKFAEALRAAGAAHGFDPSIAYTWHDETTSLAPTTQEPPQ